MGPWLPVKEALWTCGAKDKRRKTERHARRDRSTGCPCGGGPRRSLEHDVHLGALLDHIPVARTDRRRVVSRLRQAGRALPQAPRQVQRSRARAACCLAAAARCCAVLCPAMRALVPGASSSPGWPARPGTPHRIWRTNSGSYTPCPYVLHTACLLLARLVASSSTRPAPTPGAGACRACMWRAFPYPSIG